MTPPDRASARNALELDVLGPCTLRRGAHALPLAPERACQLLVWLACQPGWITRERIVALFWPDKPASAARRNLRGVLHELRRADWPLALDADGELLRWDVASDRQRFARALEAGDFEAAVQLVRGPFADGLEAGAPEPYVEWIRFEREHVLQQWRHAVARRFARLDDPVDAEAAAIAALRIDPLNEAFAHALALALAAQGRPAEAAASVSAFAQRLADDAGVAVSARLAAFLDHRGAFARLAWGLPAAPPPQPEAGFVGRRIERRELVALLGRGECRWATLLGPGGIGKSRLAQVVAATLVDAFPQGVHWIELRDLQSREQVVARLAQSAGVQPSGLDDPWTVLVAALAHARTLFVLDNVEHLPAAGDLCAALLAACPRVALLVTSRIRFARHDEWVVPLEGLPLPDADETQPEVLRTFDAIALFEARARAADPRFDIAAQAVAVRNLVRAVDGSPLAIELAAASARVLPVDDILAALLAAPADAAGGDNSLRASFLRSWRLLSASERVTLARLSVFAGTFSTAAASQVAEASLATLNALVDKSLLRTVDRGRLSLHPLVREFAAEHLAPGDAEATRARHAAHVSHWLSAATRDGASAAGVAADAVVPDAVAALRWACARGGEAVIVRIAAPLRAVLDEAGRWSEGIALFSACVESATQTLGEGGAAQAELRRCLALFHYRRGDLAAAEAGARQSLRIATSLRSLRGVDACLNLIGAAHRQRGQWAQARRYFERSLAHARAAGHRELVLRATNSLATVEKATGHLDRALSLLQSLREHAHDDEDPLGGSMTLLILGHTLEGLQRRAEAERVYDEGLALVQRHRLATMRPFFLQALAECRAAAGDVEAAARRFREVLDDGGEANEPHLAASAHLGLARMALARARCDEAFAELRRALALARRMQSASWVAAVAVRWGQALAASGEVLAGARLIATASRHPALDAGVRADADRLWDALPLTAEQRSCLLAGARAVDPIAEIARFEG